MARKNTAKRPTHHKLTEAPDPDPDAFGDNVAPRPRRGPKAKIPAILISAARAAMAAGESPSKVARKYGVDRKYARDLRDHPLARPDAPGPLPPELAAIPESRAKARLVQLYLITAAGIAWYEGLAKKGAP